MRYMRLAALAALLAGVLSGAEPAQAGRLLVWKDQKVRSYDEPALPGRAADPLPPPDQRATRANARTEWEPSQTRKEVVIDEVVSDR